ncbi:unnamed protein product [Ranitomeya imitator]|uniref:Uncharacterized protein n=1 Tax=Ranitomeya imitator TaxID=111125 RepID=A0ABN9LQ63_9NEOB|nr:unnamed protein product [Ranitomeya imitator]
MSIRMARDMRSSRVSGRSLPANSSLTLPDNPRRKTPTRGSLVHWSSEAKVTRRNNVGDGRSPDTDDGGDGQSPDTDDEGDGRSPDTDEGGDRRSPDTDDGGDGRSPDTDDGGDRRSPDTDDGGDGQSSDADDGVYHCQLLECLMKYKQEVWKMCIDAGLSVALGDKPPPLYLCEECSQRITGTRIRSHLGSGARAGREVRRPSQQRDHIALLRGAQGSPQGAPSLRDASLHRRHIAIIFDRGVPGVNVPGAVRDRSWHIVPDVSCDKQLTPGRDWRRSPP